MTTSYYHLLESLTFQPKGRGGTLISLIIHPIIMLRFLKLNLIFEESLKTKFDDLINQSYKGSRIPDYANGLFLGVLLCLKSNHDRLLKNVFLFRNKRNKPGREKFTDLVIGYLSLVEKEYRIKFVYSQDDENFLEANSGLLKQFLNRSNNRLFENGAFKFVNCYQLPD